MFSDLKIHARTAFGTIRSRTEGGATFAPSRHRFRGGCIRELPSRPAGRLGRAPNINAVGAAAPPGPRTPRRGRRPCAPGGRGPLRGGGASGGAPRRGPRPHGACKGGARVEAGGLGCSVARGRAPARRLRGARPPRGRCLSGGGPPRRPGGASRRRDGARTRATEPPTQMMVAEEGAGLAGARSTRRAWQSAGRAQADRRCKAPARPVTDDADLRGPGGAADPAPARQTLHTAFRARTRRPQAIKNAFHIWIRNRSPSNGVQVPTDVRRPREP